MIQPLRRRFYRTRNGRKIYEIVKQRTRKRAKKDWERVDLISLSRVFHVGHKSFPWLRPRDWSEKWIGKSCFIFRGILGCKYIYLGDQILLVPDEDLDLECLNICLRTKNTDDWSLTSCIGFSITNDQKCLEKDLSCNQRIYLLFRCLSELYIICVLCRTESGSGLRDKSCFDKSPFRKEGGDRE